MRSADCRDTCYLWVLAVVRSSGMDAFVSCLKPMLQQYS